MIRFGGEMQFSAERQKKKPFPQGGRDQWTDYHLRFRAASAFFLRLTLGFS